MSAILILLAGALVALSLLLALAWEIQRRTGNSGWVDVTWTYAVGIVGAAAALWPLPGGVPARQGLVAFAVAVWSLRLGTHILRRASRGGDDPRYAKLKRDWGEAAQSRMFWFLQLQAVAAFLLVVSVLAAARAPRPGPDWRDWLGVAIVLLAVAGEALADRQIAAFGRDPANRGKVCDVGLWRYSRHPNYFFEWLGWVGYVVVAVQFAGHPWGWAALVAPAYMYYLLVHVSGVPPLEEHMMATRPEAFAAYQARTNAFFPAPPRTPR